MTDDFLNYMFENTIRNKDTSKMLNGFFNVFKITKFFERKRVTVESTEKNSLLIISIGEKVRCKTTSLMCRH